MLIRKLQLHTRDDNFFTADGHQGEKNLCRGAQILPVVTWCPAHRNQTLRDRLAEWYCQYLWNREEPVDLPQDSFYSWRCMPPTSFCKLRKDTQRKVSNCATKKPLRYTRHHHCINYRIYNQLGNDQLITCCTQEFKTQVEEESSV